MQDIYIISGPNGAGKSTLAKGLLPDILDCLEYVNADAIAAGLSPFNAEDAALPAGRLMLERIHYLAKKRVSFAFETTLASRSFVPFLKQCKNQQYAIHLLFLWLPSVELAMTRVAQRVADGGHNIPLEVIKRRYLRGIENFFNLYKNLVDNWYVYDSASESPILIAEHEVDCKDDNILNESLWTQFSESIHA